MYFLYSIIMGIVQGIAEFLPVSSFGHLTILKILFGMEQGTGILPDAMLHLGTVVAICLVFQKDIRRLLQEFLGVSQDLLDNGKTWIRNKKNGENRAYKRVVHNTYRKFAMLLLVSSIPTVLIGFQARRLVELTVKNLLFPGIGFLITGILLLVVDFVGTGEKVPREVTYANAMWIGIFQGLSVFPGVSRFGITICACLLSGMNKKFAIKYSMLMSVPAVIGAFLLELGEFGSSAMTLSLGFSYFVGAAVAGGVGYFVIRFLLKQVRKIKLRYFAFYCFAIGLVAIAGNFAV